VKRILKKHITSLINRFGKISFYTSEIDYHSQIYKSKKDYHSKTASQYERLEPYLNLYKDSAVKQQARTNIEIKFSKNLAFGDSLKKAKSELGQSDYEVLDKNSLGIEILVYKLLVGGIRVKCQLHFYKSKLFLFSYNFNNPSNVKRNEIIKILNNKYLKAAHDIELPIIVDNYNNCIMLKNNGQFEINYIAHESEFFNNALNLCIARVEDENSREISFFQNMAEFV